MSKEERKWNPGLFTCYALLLYYFCQRVNPHVSEAHDGYTSFHKYVITIKTSSMKPNGKDGRAISSYPAARFESPL